MKTAPLTYLPLDSPGRTSIIPFVRKVVSALHYAVKVISIPALTLAISISIYMFLKTPSLEVFLQAGLVIFSFLLLALLVDEDIVEHKNT